MGGTLKTPMDGGHRGGLRRERERGERDVSHPWEQRSASFSPDVLLDSYSLETSFNLI